MIQRANTLRSGVRMTAPRTVKRAKTEHQTTTTTSVTARCELDTRAHTICAGINCRPLTFTGQQCEVRGFSDEFEPINNIPIATVATAWCDGTGGDTFILIFNEVLYFGDRMLHSLINPNQLRDHNIRVHDNPYEDDPARSLGIELFDDVRLPFKTDGSTIYFETTYPTLDELERCTHVTLTSDRLWNPHDISMTNTTGTRLIEEIASNQMWSQEREHYTFHTDFQLYHTDGNTEQLLFERLVQQTMVTMDTRTAQELHTSQRHSKYTVEHISKIFNVGMSKAKDILFTTTQQGIRTALQPLNRRYRIDHLNLHHNDL